MADCKHLGLVNISDFNSFRNRRWEIYHNWSRKLQKNLWFVGHSDELWTQSLKKKAAKAKKKQNNNSVFRQLLSPIWSNSSHSSKQMLNDDVTFAFLWLRLSEESLKVMEGLWDLPGVLGEASWWGLLLSQLQLLSLWRTPRGILEGGRGLGNDRV